MALKKHKFREKVTIEKEGYSNAQGVSDEGNQNREILVEALPDIQDMDIDLNVLPPQRSPSPPPRPSGR